MLGGRTEHENFTSNAYCFGVYMDTGFGNGHRGSIIGFVLAPLLH